ncbi:filamentous hemagglutinin family protein [Herbaspirillum chlorophenolicum]|uniref:Filamentous hemagglutinin family protein n=2 Tax=Herbaspirillum chlorophenolicum TaxID=211589 RepID=A0ABW8F3V0_9BURK
MNKGCRGASNHRKTIYRSIRFKESGAFRSAPLAHAVALILATGAWHSAHAQQAFSSAWFAAKGAAQSSAASTGYLPNGMPASSLTNPALQQQQANQQLQTSLNNLAIMARGIAAQQAAQAAARQAAANGTGVPDGLADGGLKVDTNSLTKGWLNANAPVQSSANGQTTVAIQQTADKAILNWETFNIGKNTIVNFLQQPNWAVLNRINDPLMRPSQIQGQLNGDGTVMIVNRNGIVFSGSSQVNTRNLVAAAAAISDSQFTSNGLYGANGTTPSFTDANGKLIVEAGAQISTAQPASVTQGGGYVLLLGSEVSNAGQISTRHGQTELAAGDSFIIRKGYGTDANAMSTTRGNEVSPQFINGSTAGQVVNSGLIVAREGDITLAGRDVQQSGVAIATTTVNTRGTIHLLNSASDTQGSVTLGRDSVTAIMIEDDGKTTALDSQRDALLKESAAQDLLRITAANATFDNLSLLTDRRDQSRIEIVSGGNVHFEGDSLTLATGGQIAVSAKNRTFVAGRAGLDVSGAIGVNVAMESNNVLVNVQGNELRDSPGNRDAGSLFNSNIWVDRRGLILVPGGTGGYAGDRWYAAGGLLEVSGYLNNQGHSIGEWAAPGGTLTLGGNEVIAQQGSVINLSGGSLDVQTGMISQTWLKGSDGKLYRADQAPAGMTYTGVYKGFEDKHERWGEKSTSYYYNPLIAARQRLENGYTVGRDGGKLIISAPTAAMEGELITTVFNGERQIKTRDALDDAYKQAQTAVASNGRLAVGRYGAGSGAGMFNSDVRLGEVSKVTEGMSVDAALSPMRSGTVWFDSAYLNALQLGGLEIATSDTITIERALTLANGGKLDFIAPVVDIKADIAARSGSISVNNTFSATAGRGVSQTLLKNGSSSIILHEGVTLDARGLWVNTALNEADSGKLAYLNGGSVRLQSTNNVLLEKDSIIDVSSGAAVLPKGKIKGGRGGNVAVIVEDKAGVLKLDGNVKGYGVNGGGKLSVTNGAGTAIGGTLLETDGVLAAGEKAPVDLVLLQDFEVKAGDVLPVDYSYTTNIALPGETLGTTNVSLSNVILGADWALPRPAAGSLGYTILTSIGTFSVGPGGTTAVIPAGTRITYLAQGQLPSSYVVPGDVFPDGLRIYDKIVTLAAGNVATSGFTVARGTRVVAGTTFNANVAVAPTTTVNTALLQSGFSSYDINGGLGLVVTAGSKLDVTMPVYRLTQTAMSAATGADSESVFSTWTPPLWTEDAAASRLTQRAGASLVLRSEGSAGWYMGGAIDVRAGAAINVDPGQAIGLSAGGGSMTVNGALTAAGGSITLTGSSAAQNKPGLIWIGEHAVLDVAARAVTATNTRGQTYGAVGKGGSILIGGAMDWEAKGEADAPHAFVVIRPGALLDASGASATLDIPASDFTQNSTPLTIASDGGSIVVKSSVGLYLDGMLRAAAGGANAAGGTLGLALETGQYPTLRSSGDVLRHREFIVSNVQGDSAIAGAASMEQAKAGLVVGTARLGVDRIHAGGFGNLSLLADGPLSFDGDVTLAMDQSLRLYAGTFALGENADANSRISLAAPYVRLAGTTRLGGDGLTFPAAIWGSGASQRPSNAVFAIDADLIDLRDRVGFGTHKDIDTKTLSYTVDRRGFGLVDMTSHGDIRLLEGLPARGIGTSAITTELSTPGSITLTAAQIYPATGVGAQIVAGYTQFNNFPSGSVLNIHRYGNTVPDLPYSAFGLLYLGAETINQGGVLRAPFGSLQLGALPRGGIQADTVNLLPGSITSVSGAGLVMPYGGTVDGLVYRYNGDMVVFDGIGGMAGTELKRGIRFGTAHLNAGAGAVLDLSGGGELSGAGFVSGRGGSVDILATPFINSNPGYAFSSKGNAVYAIVPSHAGMYAPVIKEAGYGMPLIGQQITIPNGVPGLSAGTYTLMPSSYALLPGAFRVEVGAQAGAITNGAIAASQGSYITNAYLGVANTSILASLPNQVIITAADAVRSHSLYNEMDYNAFARADAARIGVPRAMLTADAKTLDIMLIKAAVADNRSQLRFDSELLMRPASGSDGFNGTVNLRGVGEILAAGQNPATNLGYAASVYADEISKLNAPRLVLNGAISTTYGQSGRFATIQGDYNRALIVRSGANITAAEVILTSFGEGKSITIEEGASISTIGRGAASYDSSDGFIFISNAGVLALSNGMINLQQGTSDLVNRSIDITVGGCVTVNCNRSTTLVSEGTIALSTSGAFTIADNVSYGTRNLVFGLRAINLGDDTNLAATAAAGKLPAGLALNQAVLAKLLAGNTATGAPALETLMLNASDAVNMFGTVDIDASKVGRLVLGTPAIYGYGASGDVATIRAGEFVWTGAEAAPGAAMANMLGDGTLNIAAKNVVFGYAPNARASGVAVDNRLALGFANVNIAASERITSNGKGMLAVHRQQTGYTAGEGYQYSGGNLNLQTALLTGESGSVNRITAGGAITVTAPVAADVQPDNHALGGTLELISGRSILLDTAVALPSGRLVLKAEDDIVLADDARIDLSGRAVRMFDVTKYSWGGDLRLSSSAGNVMQEAGAIIDLSARNNRGGTVDVTALGAGAGHVALNGAIRGGASGQYDAGGTFVPYDAAELAVRAQTISDFAALNQRLNEGQVTGARRFQIKQGDLVVGDEVRAHNVDIALDGGDLTVNGKIDASGFQVGTIRLAAMKNLTINGALDAHGSGLRVDSYGKIIDSPNRAIVDLTSRNGYLALADSASIDLRTGTDVASGNDGVVRGTLTLNAPRLGGTGVMTGERGADGANDVAVNISGAPTIRGAKTIAVNAFRSYDDAPLAGAPDVTGHKPQEITQGYLKDIDGDNIAFINAALGNTALTRRLSGLGHYRLQPGVDIVSKISIDNPNGDLVVAGDLDLSAYRYSPDANRNDPALHGYGVPGVLAIRAAGDLNIRGSINDGFAPPPADPNHQDENGWVLGNGVLLYGGDLVLPRAVRLEAGTVFKKGVTLNYDLPASLAPIDFTNSNLAAGTVLPVKATLAGSISLPAGSVVDATIYNSDGSVAYAAGMVLPAAVTLTPGMQLEAGTVLRSAANIAPLVWPKGVPLPANMTATAPLELAAGALIPSMTDVKLASADPVDLRTATNGKQGDNWAVAPMLGAGATSWSMNLVAGADLGAADRRALRPASTAAIRLADTHYTMAPGPAQKLWAPGNWDGWPVNDPVPADALWYCDFVGQCIDGAPGPGVPLASSFSVIRTGIGDLDLIAAGDIRMNSLYGVYTAGAATAVDARYKRARGRLADGTPEGSLLGPNTADYATALSTYQAWYPDQGGNVLISAGGNLVGDIVGQSARQSPASVIVGNWLWRQGTGTTVVDENIPTSWWINFGTYALNTWTSGSTSIRPDLLGFTGIGALGGGNVAIRVGGDAGAIALRGDQGQGNLGTSRSQGLVVAVGSTGRVGADGSLMLTGGGDIDMRIAGALNPNSALTNVTEKHALPGALVNLRGALQLSAESIGSIKLIYRSGGGRNDAFDPRGVDPYIATSSDARSGITVVPGDSVVYLNTQGDLVLGGAGDPGRSQLANSSAFSAGGVSYVGGGKSWFSLWTDRTAINLISAGGNLTPTTSSSESPFQNSDQNAMDGSFIYPSILRAAALGGSMYYGINALPYMRGLLDPVVPFVTLAPSAHGSLEMLARDSIYAGQYSFSVSGSGVALPTPFNPAFMGSDVDGMGRVKVTNARNGIVDSQDNPFFLGLFVFGPNSAAQALIRPQDADPIRFYAREGDVVGLSTGETLTFGGANATTWYSAAAPVMVRAGRDIVGAGLAPDVITTSALQGANARGNLIVHGNANDVSIISAGRDIVYANFDIAGPGVLEVSAGRNLYQADKGSLTSIGPVAIGDTRPGASIVAMAGVGANGPDYTALKRYLDPANLLPIGMPLDGSGKVVKTYETELGEWLNAQYGFNGTLKEARNYFEALAPEQQHIFLRQVYFAELKAGGREYNDPDSKRFGSYLRGRDMIANMFPLQDGAGGRIVRKGDITMFGGSGVRTMFGGDIQMFAPGGKLVIGVEGQVPPASAGLVTQGSGNVQAYSEESVLLGLSRIMTTFGGDVIAWSASGDINAGRGSKTTVVYTPPKRVYDSWGNVTLSPQVPSTGAGIATLNPIPEIKPGDVDLIAPLGTIDAGEAGIRVSGNVNLAALQVVNAANIQVKGEATGIPMVAAVNVGALTNASAAASSAATAAQESVQRARNEARQALPSIFTVRVLGFGSDAPAPAPAPASAPIQSSGAAARGDQDMRIPVQVMAPGVISEQQKSRLTDKEKRLLGL